MPNNITSSLWSEVRSITTLANINLTDFTEFKSINPGVGERIQLQWNKVESSQSSIKFILESVTVAETDGVNNANLNLLFDNYNVTTKILDIDELETVDDNTLTYTTDSYFNVDVIYYFRLTAYIVIDDIAYANESIICNCVSNRITLATPVINVDVNQALITVTWSAITGSSNYIVEQKLSSSTVWEQVSTTETTFSFTGNFNYTYDIRVKAAGTGSYIDSSYSLEKSVTIQRIAISAITLSNYAPVVGQSTTATVTPVDASVTYQWSRGSSKLNYFDNISLATGASYTPTMDDVNSYIRCTAVGVDDYTGTVIATTTTVIPRISITGVSLSTNTPTIGQAITTAVTPVDASVTYQWSESDTQDSGFVNITGATGSSYTPSTAAKYIRCTVTGTDKYTNSAVATTENSVAFITLATPIISTPVVIGKTVSLSWEDIPNASSYKVAYKLSNVTEWTVNNVTSTTFSFIGAPSGSYFIKVMAIGSGNYADSDYSNTEEASILLPNLVASRYPSLNFSSVTFGNTFTVPNVTITNTGNVNSGNFTLTYYAYDADISDPPNILLGSYELASIAPGTNIIDSGRTFNSNILNVGSYYIKWVITSTNEEISTDDNVGSTNNSFAVNPAALTAPTITGSANNSSSIIINLTDVDNATSYVIEYSTDSTFATKQSKTAIVGNNTVAALSSNTTYYFRAYAVGSGNYANSNNSAVISVATAAPLFNLKTEDGGTLSSNAVEWNSTFTISNVSITNLGPETSTDYVIKYYASETIVINNSNILLGSSTKSALNLNATAIDSKTLSSANLSGGKSYYIGWIIEATGDTSLVNNSGRTTSKLNITKITLAAPSLTYTVADGVITATWTSVENSSGYELVYRSQSDTAPTTKSFNAEALQTLIFAHTGESYNLKIKAKGANNYADSAFTEVDITKVINSGSPEVTKRLQAPTLITWTYSSTPRHSVTLNISHVPDARELNVYLKRQGDSAYIKKAAVLMNNGPYTYLGTFVTLNNLSSAYDDHPLSKELRTYYIKCNASNSVYDKRLISEYSDDLILEVEPSVRSPNVTATYNQNTNELVFTFKPVVGYYKYKCSINYEIVTNNTVVKQDTIEITKELGYTSEEENITETIDTTITLNNTSFIRYRTKADGNYALSQPYARSAELSSGWSSYTKIIPFETYTLYYVNTDDESDSSLESVAVYNSEKDRYEGSLAGCINAAHLYSNPDDKNIYFDFKPGFQYYYDTETDNPSLPVIDFNIKFINKARVVIQNTVLTIEGNYDIELNNFMFYKASLNAKTKSLTLTNCLFACTETSYTPSNIIRAVTYLKYPSDDTETINYLKLSCCRIGMYYHFIEDYIDTNLVTGNHNFGKLKELNDYYKIGKGGGIYSEGDVILEQTQIYSCFVCGCQIVINPTAVKEVITDSTITGNTSTTGDGDNYTTSFSSTGGGIYSEGNIEATSCSFIQNGVDSSYGTANYYDHTYVSSESIDDFDDVMNYIIANFINNISVSHAYLIYMPTGSNTTQVAKSYLNTYTKYKKITNFPLRVALNGRGPAIFCEKSVTLNHCTLNENKYLSVYSDENITSLGNAITILMSKKPKGNDTVLTTIVSELSSTDTSTGGSINTGSIYGNAINLNYSIINDNNLKAVQNEDKYNLRSSLKSRFEQYIDIDNQTRYTLIKDDNDNDAFNAITSTNVSPVPKYNASPMSDTQFTNLVDNTGTTYNDFRHKTYETSDNIFKAYVPILRTLSTQEAANTLNYKVQTGKYFFSNYYDPVAFRIMEQTGYTYDYTNFDLYTTNVSPVSDILNLLKPTGTTYQRQTIGAYEKSIVKQLSGIDESIIVQRLYQYSYNSSTKTLQIGLAGSYPSAFINDNNAQITIKLFELDLTKDKIKNEISFVNGFTPMPILKANVLKNLETIIGEPSLSEYFSITDSMANAVGDKTTVIITLSSDVESDKLYMCSAYMEYNNYRISEAEYAIINTYSDNTIHYI